MKDALLVKPAVWQRARHRAVLEQLSDSGAVVLRGGDAAVLRREITDLEVTRIIACGGDGTVHLAVNAIQGTGVSLAVVPMGTGNDFARHLGVRTPAAGLAALQHGAASAIDVGVIQCADQPERFFVGIASCGFDAQVNERANGYPGPPGTAKYLAAVLGELRHLTALPLEVSLDQVRHDGCYTLIAVGNTSSYGGGMRMCPTAQFDDGKLDITTVAQVRRRTLLRVLPRVFRGSHVRHPAVTQHQAEHVLVSGATFPVYADGERVGSGPVQISVLRAGLMVQRAT